MSVSAIPGSDLQAMPAARVSLEEYQQLERERDRLLDQRRLFFSVLSNESLLPAERITALFTLFSIEHERSQGRAIGGYTPACVKSIARQAGIGEDAVGKAITTLAKFGAWDKTPSRPWHDPVTDTWTSPVVLKAPGTLRENLRTIARMAPTSDERKAVTGKGKPGSRPGEKREKIDRACPTCGSLNTRLQCLDCGTITHTDELTGHEERPETPPEPQVAEGGYPQVAGHRRKEIEPQVADTPSEPPLCSDRDPDPARPDALDELKAAAQWVFWTWKERDGKRTKPPYDPATGAEARSNDPTSWGTFAAACNANQRHDGAGVGFMFNRDFVGVDLDGCRDPETGAIDAEAQRIIDELRSYTEVSPSGTGVHILLRGTLPPGRRRYGTVEMYDGGRYFTVTGRHVDGTPGTIAEGTDALARLHERIFPAPDPTRSPRPRVQRSAPTADDAELIERSLQAPNGDAFGRLWRGDTTGFESASDADWQLCLYLKYRTNGDAARMDRLFRQSGLMREKWDRPDGTHGTYGERTIRKALGDA
jgi:putative DNA primase/helicase